MILKTEGLSNIQLGRLNKCLDRQWRFSTGVMTMRDYLTSQEVVGKHTWIQTHSDHKRNGCYAELARPKVYYEVDLAAGTCIEVAKIIYDALEVKGKTA